MKAMILAAGYGKRMRPLTDTTPKPLLRVAGRALIDYHIEALSEAGISDFVINVSWHAEQIEAHFAERNLAIQFSREEVPLEAAGGIVQALPLLGDAPFLVVNADIWTDYPISQLSRVVPPGDGAHLVLVDNPGHHPAGDFHRQASGLLDRRRYARLTYAGIGLFTPGLFAGVSPGQKPLLPLLEAAVQHGKLTGEYHQGRWVDVGTPERLAALDADLAIH